ncbi:MAG: cytidylate kinase-like family protein, partial [Ruminiclostridium sp.]|nr:cytidylate kinase-like family protein [Ruminiclostridium sp.]
MRKQIITIGRQCGSGGFTIGKEIAQRLNIPFYDKDYLDAAADAEAGHTPSCTSLLFCLTTGMYDGYLLSGSADHTLTDTQQALIRRLADQGPCVIVGRCSDYALKDREDCLKVFLCGEEEDRIHRMVTDASLDHDSAQRLVQSKDMMRGKHYQLVTG